MKLQTITTIELSSICNLACKYCINRLLVKDPARTAGIMEPVVFESALSWLAMLVKLGTQKEVNINGNGESLLDPDIIKRARRVKDTVGIRSVVMFCTNGLLLTKEIVFALKDAGVDRIDVSVHNAYHARRCAHLLDSAQVRGVLSDGAIRSSHNWAGQLEPEHTVPLQFSLPCHPLIEGRGYINSEGSVSPCCYDYRNLGAFGTVFDSGLLSHESAPFSLCATCHQVIPDDILQRRCAK